MNMYYNILCFLAWFLMILCRCLEVLGNKNKV